MTQENLDKPKIDDKGIPGSRVVAWLLGSMVAFPLLCWAIWYYARRLGEAEGTLFEYRAARDPIAWLITLLILIGCGILAWWMGRAAKRRH
jgi:heme/copper-type cytochrome/quinol oxidase subunit 2